MVPVILALVLISTTPSLACLGGGGGGGGGLGIGAACCAPLMPCIPAPECDSGVGAPPKGGYAAPPSSGYGVAPPYPAAPPYQPPPVYQAPSIYQGSPPYQVPQLPPAIPPAQPYKAEPQRAPTTYGLTYVPAAVVPKAMKAVQIVVERDALKGGAEEHADSITPSALLVIESSNEVE